VRRGLTARLLVATAALAVVVGVSFAVLLAALRQERDASELVAESERVLVAATDLEGLVIDLETGVRGFIITREERFLEPWSKARAALPDAIRNLEDAAVVPEQDAAARRLGEEIEAYVADYSLPLVEAARGGDPSAGSVTATEQGKERVDGLRGMFGQLLAAERSLAQARRDRAQDATSWAITAGTGGVIGSVLIILVYGGYLTRSIVVPLRRASAMAGRLAGGDLGVRMPGNGAGEIGTLERSFNRMATSLQESRDDLARLLDQQTALRRVATLVARGVSPTDVFHAVTAEVGELLDADTTRLFRYETDGTAAVVAAHGEIRAVGVGTRLPLDRDNIPAFVLRTNRPARLALEDGTESVAARLRELEVSSAVGAPVVVAGQLWGVVVAAWAHLEFPPADAEEHVADFTELVATAIANADSRAELAASRSRVVAAADDARRRIERDLHDGVQQRLVSLALELRAMDATLPPQMDDVKAQLASGVQGLGGVVEALQEVSRGVHPAILSKGGLGPALKTLVRRSGLPVELDLRGGRRLPEAVEVAAYYVVSEGLTNAAKYAGASVVNVDVEVSDRSLRLSVRDDGVGGADPRLGSGLIGLRDRVEAVGGTMDFTSSAGSGTTLLVTMPLEPDR
jgi:signal transduction histidine kinase